jgi:hypothetical protein
MVRHDIDQHPDRRPWTVPGRLRVARISLVVLDSDLANGHEMGAGMTEQKTTRRAAGKTANRPARAAKPPVRRRASARSNGHERADALVTTTDDDAVAAATVDTVDKTVDKTVGAVLALGADAAPLRAAGDESAADADVADKLSGGGVAFGTFVKSVGLAVAEAQAALDADLCKTAKELSETTIDVVAVFEQLIDDEDGSMKRGEPHLQKLPLTNYLMPTAYHWRNVHLEADMSVQEFNAKSGINIQQRSFSAGTNISGSFGVLGGSASGSASVNFSDSRTGVDSSYSQNVAAGKLHMEATLEPRGDIELPKPFILQKGPQLDLQVGTRTEIHEGGDATKPVIGMKVQLTALLKKTDGSPNANKPLSITVSEPTLSYTSTGKSDANGEMKIELTRKVANPAEDKPVETLVRVSFGLVNRSVGIVL